MEKNTQNESDILSAFEEAEQPVKLMTEDIKLNALKSSEVFLKIKPLKPGNLLIKGLKWEFLNLESFYHFDFKGKILKDGKTFEKNLKNQLTVLPNDTKMEINFKNYDENIMFGECKQQEISFVNKGTSKISQIIIATSHSQIFGFQTKVIDLNLEVGEEYNVNFLFIFFI